MSADLLRQAATILRERAKVASPGAWIPFGMNIAHEAGRCTCSPITDPYEMHESFCGLDGPIIQASEADCTYIATMHPGVGLAIADLLDTLAYDRDSGFEIDGRTWDHDIVPLARVIVGGGLTRE